MRMIGEAHDVSVARVALAWLLAQKHVTTIITGAKNEQQLRDNIEATALKLTPEDLGALEKVSALPPEYPGWMITRQAAGREPTAR
jgi:aryl-alcohol dehydrogenase-like predicted oxidoreductase